MTSRTGRPIQNETIPNQNGRHVLTQDSSPVDHKASYTTEATDPRDAGTRDPSTMDLDLPRSPESPSESVRTPPV